MAENISGDGEFMSLAGKIGNTGGMAAVAMAATGMPLRERPPKCAGKILGFPTLNIFKFYANFFFFTIFSIFLALFFALFFLVDHVVAEGRSIIDNQIIIIMAIQ